MDAGEEPAVGRPDRKKRQTREAIAAAAFELFADHGFDGVTVAEVARRANVSEATVFDYLPTTEDLLYGRLEELAAALLRAIRQRPAGQSISTAFRGFLLVQRGLLGVGDPEARLSAKAVRAQAIRALAVLDRGLGEYPDHR